MSTYMTYNMAGIKQEFADWVSNISPEVTPFISMIRKVPVKNTKFQWQSDELSYVDIHNDHIEGSDAASVTLAPTTIHHNYTQIMRKVVAVSDTANAVSSYGREKELFYQLKKAAAELKRDNEAIFLMRDQIGKHTASGTVGKTTSFGKLISPLHQYHLHPDNFEFSLYSVTRELYASGSEANIIMYHPKLASMFAGLQERNGFRRIFENDKRFVKQVEYIVDPLGQEYKCIPNRWIQENTIYIFNPSDLAMAVLRAPQQIRLDKKGSAEKYMIEQEVGLRLDNLEAAAIMVITDDAKAFETPVFIDHTATETWPAKPGSEVFLRFSAGSVTGEKGVITMTPKKGGSIHTFNATDLTAGGCKFAIPALAADGEYITQLQLIPTAGGDPHATSNGFKVIVQKREVYVGEDETPVAPEVG